MKKLRSSCGTLRTLRSKSKFKRRDAHQVSSASVLSYTQSKVMHKTQGHTFAGGCYEDAAAEFGGIWDQNGFESIWKTD